MGLTNGTRYKKTPLRPYSSQSAENSGLAWLCLGPLHLLSQETPPSWANRGSCPPKLMTLDVIFCFSIPGQGPRRVRLCRAGGWGKAMSPLATWALGRQHALFESREVYKHSSEGLMVQGDLSYVESCCYREACPPPPPPAPAFLYSQSFHPPSAVSILHK